MAMPAHTETLGDYALAYAARGLEIFPADPADKAPLCTNGLYDATTNPDTIETWWRRWPNALIACRVPDDTVILDIDPRHGGHDTWAALCDAYGDAAPTRWHASGRGDGGQHHWWQHPGGKLNVKKLNDFARSAGVGHPAGKRGWTGGIDLLHHGHRYTILPPSPHPDTGQPYVWGPKTKPGRMPGWLAALLTADQSAASEPALRVVKDADSIADWFTANTTWREILIGWHLVDGDGDNDGSAWRHPNATASQSATIKHGCLFVYTPNTDFEPTESGDPHGYTRFRAWALLEHDGNLTAAAAAAYELRDGPREPPERINPDDLIGDSIRHAVEQAAANAEPHRLWANLHRGDEILHLPPTEWLIPGVIQRGGLTVTYGAPKSYKTFVVLDRALHLANGQTWRNIEVVRSRILYVVAEGAPGVGPRAWAWCKRHDGTLNGIDWITVAPNLFDERLGADTYILADIIRELAADHVIFDTFARSTAGADENSGRDMGVIVDHLGWLMERTGCGIELVHHTGKDAARGMRGHSSLQGAVDTSIEVIGDSHAVNARVVDQKNAESDQAWWWKPRRYEASIVLEATDGLESSGEVRDVNILRQLQLIDSGDGVAFTAWRDACVERELCGKTTFYERLKELADRALVVNEGTKQRAVWRLTLDGMDLLRRAAG